MYYCQSVLYRRYHSTFTVFVNVGYSGAVEVCRNTQFIYYLRTQTMPIQYAAIGDTFIYCTNILYITPYHVNLL